MTPSDVEHALELGCTAAKILPRLRRRRPGDDQGPRRPYAHTGLKLIPLGGVTAQNMADYLAHPLVAAVGGSWLVDKKLVAANALQDWSLDRHHPAPKLVRAREAVAIDYD
jgi:2-dehydro-3-deoxyphosphogluconate aldolase/(4S)-4-hydroxy-2-oxoglutarate aldolase